MLTHTYVFLCQRERGLNAGEWNGSWFVLETPMSQGSRAWRWRARTCVFACVQFFSFPLCRETPFYVSAPSEGRCLPIEVSEVKAVGTPASAQEETCYRKAAAWNRGVKRTIRPEEYCLHCSAMHIIYNTADALGCALLSFYRWSLVVWWSPRSSRAIVMVCWRFRSDMQHSIARTVTSSPQAEL